MRCSAHGIDSERDISLHRMYTDTVEPTPWRANILQPSILSTTPRLSCLSRSRNVRRWRCSSQRDPSPLIRITWRRSTICQMLGSMITILNLSFSQFGTTPTSTSPTAPPPPPNLALEMGHRILKLKARSIPDLSWFEYIEGENTNRMVQIWWKLNKE